MESQGRVRESQVTFALVHPKVTEKVELTPSVQFWIGVAIGKRAERDPDSKREMKSKVCTQRALNAYRII